MAESSSLEIKIVSDTVQTASKHLHEMKGHAEEAERSTEKLMETFKEIAEPLIVLFTTFEGLKKIVEVTKAFDDMEASLVTATGNAKDAAEAFEVMRDLEEKTPFTLESLTEAFKTLVNRGLDPSEKAMMSYGNIAAATGQDINSVVDIVARASVGMTRSLMQLGVRAENDGNKLKLTFQGATTTIANNSASIQKYLQDIGNNQFAEGMKNKMGTMGVAIKQLDDAWEHLFLNVSRSGVGDLIATAFHKATEAMNYLNDLLASGVLVGHLKAFSTAFSGMGEGASDALSLVSASWHEFMLALNLDGRSLVGLISGVQTRIAQLTVVAASTFDKARAYVVAEIQRSQNAVRPDKITDGTNEEAIARQLKAKIDAANYGATETIYALEREDKERGLAYEAEIARIRKLREEYEAKKKANEENEDDRLKRFNKGGGGSKSAEKDPELEAAKKAFAKLQEELLSEELQLRAQYDARNKLIERFTKPGEHRDELEEASRGTYQKALAALKEAQEKEIAHIEGSLKKEEELITESYEKRVQIVKDNTPTGSDRQNQLLAGIRKQYTDQINAVREGEERKRDELRSPYRTELEDMQEQHRRRLQLIRTSTEIEGKEKTALVGKEEKKYHQDMLQYQLGQSQASVHSAEQMFGSLAAVAKKYGGEQSATFRTLFAIQKAFAIAEGTLNVASAISNASKVPYPANIPLMIQAAATGAALVAQIAGASYQGAFDAGGDILSGKYGIVGEHGPEIVMGPANVTSRADTAKMIAGAAANGGGGSSRSNVRIVNAMDPNIERARALRHMGSADGELVVMNILNRNAEKIRQMSGR